MLLLIFKPLIPYINSIFRLELLDGALLRAGRFDRIIQCPLPDKAGREAILGVHTRKLSLSPDVDLAR